MDGPTFEVGMAVTISDDPDAVWTIERKKRKSAVLFRYDPILNRLIRKEVEYQLLSTPRQV
jgi:hypothetical protein